MKVKAGVTVAVLFLTVAALAAGFYMPEFAGRASDRQISARTETFPTEAISPGNDARLRDMLELATSYVNEMYLTSGIVRNEKEIRSIAADLITQMSDSGLMDGTLCEDFELYPFIAVGGDGTPDSYAAYGYDTGNAVQETADEAAAVSDEDGINSGMPMGILWNCFVFDEQDGRSIEMIIDDQSGKMLSFHTILTRSDQEMEGIYKRLGVEPESVLEEAQKDLQERSEKMRMFCEKYYGFRYKETEYYTEEGRCVARMRFEDEEGEKISLDLERNLEGTAYTWN